MNRGELHRGAAIVILEGLAFSLPNLKTSARARLNKMPIIRVCLYFYFQCTKDDCKNYCLRDVFTRHPKILRVGGYKVLCSPDWFTFYIFILPRLPVK